MNKFLKLILIPLAVLTASCQSNVDYSGLKIVCPTGAPSVAFYNYSDNANFTTNSVPSNIVAMMAGNSEYDVAVIDTTSGIKAINAGADFSLAATITFGNFYIASTGNDDNGTLDGDDKIVLFGQNQTPDLLFHYIYGDQYDSNIEFVTNVSEAATVLASGKNMATGTVVDYVFIAQPVLFATLNNQEAATYGKATVYANVQELYKQKSGNLDVIQASVFVNNKTDRSKLNAFLDNLKNDIEAAISDPNCITEGMNKIDADKAVALYGVKSAPIVATIKNNNSLGLGFKLAKENKEAINQYISLFGLGALNETVYFA